MIKVAYQGEPGAYSESASKAYFPGNIKLLPSETFALVFKRIQDGEADFGVIPVENSLYGSIFETYDLLLRYSHKITGELKLAINHYLMGYKKYNIADLKRIYSHPQALGQCSEFLGSLKNTEIIPIYDTAGAARNIMNSKEEFAAAIAGKGAAGNYGLKIIKGNISNDKENYTRFLVITSEERKVRVEGSRLKTSICFGLKSVPGALFKALSVFALRDINLTKIESRPIPQKTFQYMFYIDLAGGQNDEPVKNAIMHLREFTESVRILGCYDTGRVIK